MTEAERERFVGLLESTHTFPVHYPLSVITLNDEAVITALRAAIAEGLAEPLPESAHQILSSQGGKYVSHRVRVPCVQAADVLTLYARVQQVVGVVTVM